MTDTGSHGHRADARNKDILINVNGQMVPRAEARVSVFDSGFVLGDGVWEGLRVHNGVPAFMDEHLARLYNGARALAMDIGITRAQMAQRIHQTLQANSMRDGVHIRLMVTRGEKATPYQDPRASAGPATIVIIAEHKQAAPPKRGISLFSVHIRRGPPDTQDPKLNSHSKLNCILACIQATRAGADEALMMDPQGFVATCNSTHFFMVRGGEVWTSSGDYCLDGITRRKVMELCDEHGIRLHARNFSTTDVYAADEAFVTGTHGGLTPCRELDGRPFPACPGPTTTRLQELYGQLLARHCREAR